MKCQKCGHDLPDRAKRCSFCGADLLQEEQKTDPSEMKDSESVPKTPHEKEQIVLEQAQPEEEKIWHYADHGDSYGPFTLAEMHQFLKNGTLSEMSFVWTKGMSDWKRWKDSDLADSVDPTPQLEQELWYYVDQDNTQTGPFEKYMMVDLITKGTIHSETYVWKTGMEDWVRLKDSSLSDKLNKTGRRQTSVSNELDVPSYDIVPRDIAISIVLSIVTCGIYLLYWMYCIANDSNRILLANGKRDGMSGGLVVLFTIVTCGIFSLYFFWKVSKDLLTVPTKGDYVIQDNAVVSVVLAFVGLSLVSMAIIQDEINGIIRNAQ
ncbi:MAG: DUF4339 domain-containing protein [Erysipelotrichaceae bacterium]|nr:DUF4339 domain-containing protein [Erysipelotrichaceae bacterium]